MHGSPEACKPHRIRMCLLLLAALLAWGCAAPQGRWTRGDYHLAYGLPFLDRETLREPLTPASSLQDVSSRICILSDNQRHELLGSGIELYRMSAADTVIEASAIRPPQLDLFGQDLLGEALGKTSDFVLHLGDACDVSNSGEFALFAWDMRRAPHGWLMAPGNHDGYFMGNVSRTGDSWVLEWNEAAEQYQQDETMIASRAMQKDDYIGYYLAALILQDARWSESLARHLGPECVAIYERWTSLQKDSGTPTFARYWQHLESLQAAAYKASVSATGGPTHQLDLGASATTGTGITLHRIAWAIDVEAPWRSYLTQEIDISLAAGNPGDSVRPISMLVLDTAQYKYQPSMEHAFLSGALSLTGVFDVQLAGTHGNILQSQVDSIDWMMDAMRAEQRLWIVASHHPYASLGRNSPSRFDRIRDAGGVPVTLSAHTHAGEIRWNHDGGHEGDWLEINVGSLLDAPVEYRDFQVHRIGDRLAVSSRRFVMENQLRKAGLMADDMPGYRPSPGDPDYYMDYQRGNSLSEDESELAVKHILLTAYLRMFRLFETDEHDPGRTTWPVRADGVVLGSHGEVLTEIVRMAAQPDDAIDVAELTHLLYALREYDRTRPLPESTRQALRAYRVSQAIWAGQSELEQKTRRPFEVDPGISFMLLPPHASTASP